MSWNPNSGRQLRALREHLSFSLRDVEQHSRRISADRQNPDFYISHSSLADIENGKQEPTLFKLYSLGVIYGYQYTELVILCGVPLNDTRRDYSAMALDRTFRIVVPEHADRVVLPQEVRERLRTEPTNLVSRMISQWDDIPRMLFQQLGWHDALYGYIGMKDYTLFPFVRPGTFVEIDPRQKKVSMDWHGDHDRPVFFLELRDKYVCAWCERHANQLIIVPSRESRSQVRRLQYPDDVGIVGRVTAWTQRIAEGGGTSSGEE